MANEPGTVLQSASARAASSPLSMNVSGNNPIIIKDKMTGQSKGFGFLEMPDSAEAEAAITGWNGRDLMGRRLNVNEARPRPAAGGNGGFRRAVSM